MLCFLANAILRRARYFRAFIRLVECVELYCFHASYQLVGNAHKLSVELAKQLIDPAQVVKYCT